GDHGHRHRIDRGRLGVHPRQSALAQRRRPRLRISRRRRTVLRPGGGAVQGPRRRCGLRRGLRRRQSVRRGRDEVRRSSGPPAHRRDVLTAKVTRRYGQFRDGDGWETARTNRARGPQFIETLLPLITTSLEPWMVIFPPLMVMSPPLLSVTVALPEVMVIWSPADTASFWLIWRVSPLLTLTLRLPPTLMVSSFDTL